MTRDAGSLLRTTTARPRGTDMKKAHPGFKAVQKRIAKKQGVGMERAGAILAAGARKAGRKAVKANPRLKRVSGVKKGR